MSWPPKIGEPLSRAEDAYGVYEKLVGYSLKVGHEDGGPKPLRSSGSSASPLTTRTTSQPLSSPAFATCLCPRFVTEGEHGMHCQVIVPVRGLRDRVDRVANILTAWEIRWDGDAPRLVTAFITSKVVR